jgi:Tfp pilus assembly protein PilP
METQVKITIGCAVNVSRIKNGYFTGYFAGVVTGIKDGKIQVVSCMNGSKKLWYSAANVTIKNK